jgi:hypothetical protein
MEFGNLKSKHMNASCLSCKRLFPVFLSLLVILPLSCTKDPVAKFTYTPLDNPEAGDTIQFQNISTDATSFEWEFGDGGTSSLKEPRHIYSDPGTYEVKLTAVNEKSSAHTVEALQINDPTIMLIQVFGLDEDTLVLEEAEVWLYDNQYDWEHFDESLPQYTQVTDGDGFVVFMNLEPIQYFVLVLKLEELGFWAYYGYTVEPLEQNMINIFYLPCDWFLWEEEKAASVGQLPVSQMKRK